MRKIKNFLSLALIVLLSVDVCAQHSSNSPFTRFGLGEMTNFATPYNLSLGGAFSSLRNRAHVNIANPASYTASPQQSFLLEFAFQNKNSFYNEREKSARTADGNLNFMAAQFPVAKWWSASFGLIPYSNLGYKISHTGSIVGTSDSVTYSYLGNGGINTVFIGNAFKIAHRLSIGLNANFLYGTNQYVKTVALTYSDFESRTVEKTDMRFHKFNYRLGIQYFDTLFNNYHFTLGATFENKTDMNAFTEQKIVNYYLINGVQFFDTLQNNLSGNEIIQLPQYFSAGITLAKTNKISLTLDYYARNWKNAQFLSEPYADYNKEYGYSFGSEYIPNLGAPQFWRNIRFRLGTYFKQTNIKIDNNPLMDYGLGFGFGIPIKASGTIANIAFNLGQKTTGKVGTLSETYANVYINISMGSIWFIKRKYD